MPVKLCTIHDVLAISRICYVKLATTLVTFALFLSGLTEQKDLAYGTTMRTTSYGGIPWCSSYNLLSLSSTHRKPVIGHGITRSAGRGI